MRNNVATPLVSVLMPVHNAAPFLAAAIAGILRQTVENIEFIIVDDASTDETPALLRAAAARDARIVLITNETNLGLTRSLNLALARARGPLIARQDGDDISLPARLELQIERLQQDNRCAAVGSAFEVMDVDGSPLSTSHPPVEPRKIARLLRRKNPLAHGSLLFRAEALRAVRGYSEEFRSAQDYDLLTRLSAAWTIAAIPDVVYRLRLVPSGISLSQQAGQAALAGKVRGRKAGEAVAIADGGASGQARYHVLKALHLIKSGRTELARQELAKSGVGTPQTFALRMLSHVPGPLRRLMFAVKRWVEGA